MAEAQLMGKLKDGREVYEACAPLDAQILALKQEGITAPYLATPDEVALIRTDGVHTHWSRTSYAPIKVRGKPTIITADSPWMNEAMACVAMKAHESGEYPSMPEFFYESVEQIAKRQQSLAPEDRTVHILEGKADSNDVIKLSPEMDDTKFLLKKLATEYFKQFKNITIPFYDMSNDVPKGRANVNYLYFGGPRNGSGLVAWDRGLHDDDGASGVRELTSAAGSKNFGYTTTNVRDAVRKAIPELCKQTGITGIEGIIAPHAEKIILRSLKSQKGQSF